MQKICDIDIHGNSKLYVTFGHDSMDIAIFHQFFLVLSMLIDKSCRNMSEMLQVTFATNLPICYGMSKITTLTLENW